MSEEIASLTLTIVRRLDIKVDRLVADMHDVKVRVTSIEENMGAMNRRLDRMDDRMERLERHADLVDSSN